MPVPSKKSVMKVDAF